MDSEIKSRIDIELKDKFKKIAKLKNPHLSENQIMSIVLRELISDYVKKNESLLKES